MLFNHCHNIKMENNLSDCFLSFICKGSNKHVDGWMEMEKKNDATNKQINPLFVNVG